MKDLKYLQKELNAIFTNTLNKRDFCALDFDIAKVAINYENTISLYKLASSFNELYLKFKKEYDQLDKLYECGKFNILTFDKYVYNNINYRTLIVDVSNDNIGYERASLLFLKEKNQEIKTYVTNNIIFNPDNKGYYRENLNLDSSKVKAYLDLCEKYQVLFEPYNCLKNKFIFGDGTNVLFSKIVGSLANGLDYFEFEYGSVYINASYTIKLFINLGENFGIDYSKSEVIWNEEKIDVDKKVLKILFNETYINQSYLMGKR